MTNNLANRLSIQSFSLLKPDMFWELADHSFEKWYTKKEKQKNYLEKKTHVQYSWIFVFWFLHELTESQQPINHEVLIEMETKFKMYRNRSETI